MVRFAVSVRSTGAWPIGLFALMIAAFAGCGDGATSGAGAVEGREFHARSVTGRDLVEGTSIVLTFDRGTIRARAGCNILGAPYAIDGGRLVVHGDGMSTTAIGCDRARHEQDEWLAAFLQDRPGFDLAGDDLTLTTDDAEIRLVDRVVADPDRPLIGPRWRVTSVITGDSVSTVPTAGHVVIEWRDDRTLLATAVGCTSAEVAFEQVDGTLRFDRFVVDAIGCPEPWGATLDVLGAGEARYSIVASQLTLTATTGIGIGADAEPGDLADSRPR